MKNSEVAVVLERIGQLLEVDGEGSFKVRAYERAAQSIEGLHDPLSQAIGENRLTKVPGIGTSIAAKIEEILSTGTCKAYEDLKRKVPPGVVAMLGIPGVGPKKAGVLYRELKISSIDELEKAATAGRLREHPGMGKKTEENILEGIERLKARPDRLGIGIVRPYAEAIVDALRGTPGVTQIEVAGSLRRWRETVKDLDVVAASSDPTALIEAFTLLPQVDKVILQGDTKTTVLTDLGIQADLRVVAPGQFAALLNHFTGSMAHNVRLRTIARSRGLRINEYGVFQEPGGEPVALGDDENALYDLLKIQFVPPEMREDSGEVEAAAAGRLPVVVALSDIRCDLHCHTRYSDGTATVDEMALAARDRGYSHLSIADHSPSLTVAHGLSVDDLRRQIKEIREWNDQNADDNFRLLAGTECDILADGSLDWPDELLDELDVVVASVHSRFKMEEKEMTARIVRAIQSGKVDIVGHPTGRLIGSRDPYALDIAAVLKAAKETGTCMEINAHPERLDLSDHHARLAKEMGLRIAINSDAHSTDGLEVMEYGVHSARRAWLAPDDVVNTYPVDRLLKVLAREE